MLEEHARKILKEGMSTKLWDKKLTPLLLDTKWEPVPYRANQWKCSVNNIEYKIWSGDNGNCIMVTHNLPNGGRMHHPFELNSEPKLP